jgi:hypothetical protein
MVLSNVVLGRFCSNSAVLAGRQRVLATITANLPLCFQSLPTIKFCNPFVLITIRIAGGVGSGGPLQVLEMR